MYDLHARRITRPWLTLGRAQTYSGIVLVAVNPFAAVPLYEPNLVQAYAGKKKGDVSARFCN